MCARCILSTIPRMRHVNTYTQRVHTPAHSFAIHRLSPLAERGPPPRVVICRACNDREGRDSLEAAWDMPFLIRPKCKPERSCSPSFLRSSFFFLFHCRFLCVFEFLNRIRNLYCDRFARDRFDRNRFPCLSCNLRIGVGDRQRRIDPEPLKLPTITNCD